VAAPVRRAAATPIHRCFGNRLPSCAALFDAERAGAPPIMKCL
jgi:hypothetical protein